MDDGSNNESGEISTSDNAQSAFETAQTTIAARSAPESDDSQELENDLNDGLKQDEADDVDPELDSQDQQTDEDEPGDDGAGDEATESDDDTAPASDEAAASELAVPDHWPDSIKSVAESLPAEAQEAFVGLTNQLQQAIQGEWQQLNEKAETHADPIRLAEKFSDDPRAVLEELASRAEIPIFFEQEEEMPEFDDPKDIAKWVDERSTKRANEQRRSDDRKANQARQEETRKTQLQAGFKSAVETYPDFLQHRDAVLKVFDAYGDITPDRKSVV